jgi:hypothetical protein
MNKKYNLILTVLLIVIASSQSLFALEKKQHALADSFVEVATWLKVSREDEKTCRQFLKFALKLNPRCRQGLLLQARLDNSKLTSQIDSAVLSSDVKDFVVKLDALAQKQTNKIRKLVLYKFVALLDKDNENALIAVTHAENNKYDATIEELIEKF